jgi:hypothetical protein
MQTLRISQVPALTIPSLSDLCARYLQMRFQIELDARSPPQIGASMSPPDHPLMLPVALASELDQIAFTLADAFLNRGKHSGRQSISLSCPSKATLAVEIKWDASRYAERVPNIPRSLLTTTAIRREDSIKQQYPPIPNGISISKPCIICDMQGIILTWYLPGILNDSRQASPIHTCPIAAGALMPFRVKC